MTQSIAYPGVPGAYSDLACRAAAPDYRPLPCLTFEDSFAAVHDGKAARAMIPLENALAGRVADVHHLLPEGGLHIVGEHYQPVRHCLLGLRGARLDDVREALSHEQALAQCRRFLREQGINPMAWVDTADAAREVVERSDPAQAAIASSLAGDLYGLDVLAEDIADARGNVTRFLILAKEPILPDPSAGLCVTSLVFRVRSVPAALYKALGGFATNGVNITKLESYLVDGRFTAAQFFLEAEGHPDEKPMRLALEELAFFAHEVRMLGTYPAHAFRLG